MKIETDKRPASFALASFHHAISEGDLGKVKDYVQGKSSSPGAPAIRISCNQQDEDGFAAVHWAAIKGRLEILRYLVEQAPENNRADPTMADRDGWTALTWAIFSAESAGKDFGRRKAACEVVNFLARLPAVRPLLAAPDRLLRRTPQELALAAARQSDEAITAALRGEYDPRKAYGPLKDADEDEEDGDWDEDGGEYDGGGGSADDS